MDALELFALQLAAALIVGGMLLVITAFLITQLDKERKRKQRGMQPHADAFDVLLELAKKVPIVYVPGLLMIGFGVVIVLAVVGVGPASTA